MSGVLGDRPPVVASVAAPHGVFSACGVEFLSPPATRPCSLGARRPICNICEFTGRVVSARAQKTGEGCRSCPMGPRRTHNLTRLPGSHLPGNGMPSISKTATSPWVRRCDACAVLPTHAAPTATPTGFGPLANNAGKRHAKSSDSAPVGDSPGQRTPPSTPRGLRRSHRRDSELVRVHRRNVLIRAADRGCAALAG